VFIYGIFLVDDLLQNQDKIIVTIVFKALQQAPGDTGTKRKTLKLGTPANAARKRGTLGGGSSPSNLAMLKKPSNRSSSVASETPSKINKSERDEDEGAV